MIFVILPAYNEEGSIRRMVLDVASATAGARLEARAVVVNDGSEDGTRDEADDASRACARRLPVDILDHPRNRGLGAALRTGISWCLERASDDDAIVTLDSDTTHPPSLIPEIVARLSEGYDVVVASRYQPGSAIAGVPANRRALSDIGRVLLGSAFGIPGVRDYTCCFRGYRAAILRDAQRVYGADFLAQDGFEAVMDILLRLRPLGPRATEVPLNLDYSRRGGDSKMRVVRTVVATMSLLARRFIEGRARYSPARVRALRDAARAR